MTALDDKTLAIAHACKGFLDEDEGLRLYSLARDHARLGPIVEIGSYCGKSSVYVGAGTRESGGTLLCVDHHRGNEEQQRGEAYHDPDLYDPNAGLLDSLGVLRNTIREAGLEDTVVLMVTRSATAARLMKDGAGMVFIDGGHTLEAASADYEAWHTKIVSGGILAIHDLFPDPSQGGQAPITIYRRALDSGLFDQLETTKTLGVLRKR